MIKINILKAKKKKQHTIIGIECKQKVGNSMKKEMLEIRHVFIHIMGQRIPLVCLLIDWPYRQKSLKFKDKGEKDML